MGGPPRINKRHAVSGVQKVMGSPGAKDAGSNDCNMISAFVLWSSRGDRRNGRAAHPDEERATRYAQRFHATRISRARPSAREAEAAAAVVEGRKLPWLRSLTHPGRSALQAVVEEEAVAAPAVQPLPFLQSSCGQ